MYLSSTIVVYCGKELYYYCIPTVVERRRAARERPQQKMRSMYRKKSGTLKLFPKWRRKYTHIVNAEYSEQRRHDVSLHYTFFVNKKNMMSKKYHIFQSRWTFLCLLNAQTALLLYSSYPGNVLIRQICRNKKSWQDEKSSFSWYPLLFENPRNAKETYKWIFLQEVLLAILLEKNALYLHNCRIDAFFSN